MFKSPMLLWLLLTATVTHSQDFINATIDTVIVGKPRTGNLKFTCKQLVIPAVLIGYGTYALESGQLKSFNRQLQKEVTEDIDNKLTIDDFSQYAPMASVFALHALGAKSKNSYKDQALIMATSYLILSTTVFSLKSLTHEMRPDGTTANSFPSGHTANAFAGAEFMWQEYKDESVWYGIAGYLIATGTGAFRVYNNRHWLSDVAAGAGIGILSTKIAYWVSPLLKDRLFGQIATGILLFVGAILVFWKITNCGCCASLILTPVLNLMLPVPLVPLSLSICTFSSSVSRIIVFRKHLLAYCIGISKC